jgi:hypothetical protein
MKILCYVFVAYLVLGLVMVVAGSIYAFFARPSKDKSRGSKNNYGYPYLDFNNPFMDGFE